ncbi:ATP-dependent DNA helicase RecG [Okibacterium endophyticum]
MTGSDLDTKLNGVIGPRTAAALARAFDVETTGDLLMHYPRRYASRGELTAIDQLPVGENVTIIAEVLQVTNRTMKSRKGSILEAKITDGKGILTLTFFNQAWRSKELAAGVRGIFAGKVGEYRDALQLAHPDYKLFDAEVADRPDAAAAREWVTKPIPIYPATSTVSSWQIQASIDLVLDDLGEIDDPIPADVRSTERLLDYRNALERIHRPSTDVDWHAARRTLRFAEAFILQTALVQQRQQTKRSEAYPRQPRPGGVLERFDAALPFELTGDQNRVGHEIAYDMSGRSPMNRLVQGEVGSGKTLVALRAMLTVADSGGQSALLAPTEVLATQHLRSMVKALGPDIAAEVKPVLLTGQMTTAERKRAMLLIVSGQAQIVIGTHALLSDSVTFFDLGLIVVDEQHRFGVEQRDTLKGKAQRPPHVLVLTATPIPRTIAMTVFGDLDVSTIRELPSGRIGIETFVVPLAEKPEWFGRIWARVAEEIAAGRQAFVVCPAIDPGVVEDDGEPAPDDADSHGSPSGRTVAAVTTVLEELTRVPALTGARIGALHGRMSADDKDRIMQRFSAGELDVLVSTTVIEVGVDVPNASVMVVLDADRFGVSQLHQLRGRIGRGEFAGVCLLVTAAEQETPARERVQAIADTLDGFRLAEIDLELRREGDVLGSVQSGRRSSLRLLRVTTDGEIIEAARAHAENLLEADPALARHPATAEALARSVDERERAALRKG